MNLTLSVWEMISDIVPENDALICGDEIFRGKIMICNQARLQQH